MISNKSLYAGFIGFLDSVAKKDDTTVTIKLKYPFSLVPERLAVARAILPRGTVPIEFQTGAGVYKTEVTVGNRVTVIPIRLANGAVYVGQPEVEAWASLFTDEPVKPAKRKAKTSK